MGKLLNVGYGNAVVSARVVAIVTPSSAPIKRLMEEARESGRLVDATQGRRTRSIVITDSDHVVLTALAPETVAARFLLPDVPPARGAELGPEGDDEVAGS